MLFPLTQGTSPRGGGRAVVGHPRGETFVKIFENEVMIWRTL